MRTWLCLSLIKTNDRNSSSSQLLASRNIELLESSYVNETTADLSATTIFFWFFQFSARFRWRALQFHACCDGNWSDELKLRSFDATWSVWSWITNPNSDPPKGAHLKFRWKSSFNHTPSHKSAFSKEKLLSVTSNSQRRLIPQMPK